MSRRSTRVLDKTVKSEEIEPITSLTTSNKRQAIKVEEEIHKAAAPVKSDTKKKPAATKDSVSRNPKEEEEELEAQIETPPVSSKPGKDSKRTVAVSTAVKEDLVTQSSLPERKISSVKGKAATEKIKPQAKVKRKTKDTEDDIEENIEDKKVVKKRKTKEEKEAEAMPLAERTLVGTLKKAMHIGAHVSGAGGVQNSINNSLHIGGNSFALFLKSQRKWTSPPLAPEARDQFKAFCLEHKYDAAKHVLPHGSYLVNLAQPDHEKAEQAYSCFLDDLQRCEALGIVLYNFHPGSTGPHPRAEAIARIAAQLNKAHKATKTVITVLENMAGSGNVIGSTWEDLRDIIALVEDKSRVGVCIDTCHTFAAGYDLRTPETFKEVMDNFSSIVGMQYLKALHLNDSKAPLASNRDLHANIGTGFLGLRAFHNVMNFSPFQGLPMVLETPIDKKGADGKAVEDKSVWAKEIKLLEGLIGTDAATVEFKNEEERLQDIGADERNKFQGQVDKKKQQSIDSMFKKGKKKKPKKAEDPEDSEGSEGGCSH
ncbi:apurinic endonuclease [Phlyctema vagabunda]|uniref:Apurinic endonuclease n=1 Tax=Phlyctema vagabunda TaxID=108571 RepID=A0ABR4P6Y3_9HELO